MPSRNIVGKRIYGSFAIFATFASAMLMPGAAHAQTLYGIGEDLWRFDLSGTTATATKINDFASTFWTQTSTGGAGNGNSLAFDNVHNALLFSDAASRTLYSYSLSTSTLTNLGTLTLAGYDLSSYNLQGSSAFYNGKLYIMPELINGQTAASPANPPWNFMMSVTLNAAGTGIASTAIVGGTTASPNSQWGSNVTNGFGNGGDMAIDQNGKVYGFSSAVTNPTGTTSIAGYYTANVTSPTSGVTVVNASLTTGQAALQNGVLYHNTGSTSIQSLNVATGATVTTYTLSGFNDAIGLADLGATDTPEPGSIALMVSAGAVPAGGFFLRRRRAARKDANASA